MLYALVAECPADTEQWHCKACGCNEHECECAAEDMDIDPSEADYDGYDDYFEVNGDQYDIEYDRTDNGIR